MRNFDQIKAGDTVNVKYAEALSIELKKGGKATVTTTADDKETTTEATYKVDGNKLIVTLTVGGEEKAHTHTVSKLTDTELVGADEKGKEHTLVRVKDK